MTLHARLTHAELRVGGPTRQIIVLNVDDEREPHGTITPWPNGQGYTLSVPRRYEADPMPGLTPHQGRFIRPGDRVFKICLLEEDADGNEQATEAVQVA
jgi:hypothetical protein